MKVYRKRVVLDDYEEREVYVFNSVIKEIHYWGDTDEVDLMQCAHQVGYVTRFNSIIGTLLSDDLKELREDTIDLSVREFWDKYENKLSGMWCEDIKVVL